MLTDMLLAACRGASEHRVDLTAIPNLAVLPRPIRQGRTYRAVPRAS
jgi:hypothetical protein